jgi:PAS domain S-box-containing protein
MRVLIVDDHQLIRQGIRSLLVEEPGWVICGEAVDGRDAVAKAKELKPDVIVMDISMPNLNGLEATREIRMACPQTEVLIVTQHENREMVRQAILAGAKGYVVKSCLSRDLLQALTKVSQHQSTFETGELEPWTTNMDAQEILQRSAALEVALRDSERRYRALITAISEIVWRTDAHGRLLFISSRWFELSGQSESEALGWGWIKAVHPEDRERLTRTWEHAILTPEEYSQEWRMITREGEPRHLATRAIPIRGDDGGVREWVGVVFDIHERRLAEDALRATATNVSKLPI